MATPEDQQVCPKCKAPGRHFVKPSMGKYGYFRCDSEEGQEAR